MNYILVTNGNQIGLKMIQIHVLLCCVIFMSIEAKNTITRYSSNLDNSPDRRIAGGHNVPEVYDN